jgi:hypothetical protein
MWPVAALPAYGRVGPRIYQLAQFSNGFTGSDLETTRSDMVPATLRHDIPVLALNNIPLVTRRSSTRGRPFAPGRAATARSPATAHRSTHACAPQPKIKPGQSHQL